MDNSSKNKQKQENQYQQAFVQDIHTGETLVKKELLVIGSEELLLKHRIVMMKEFLRTLPPGDPQYGMVVAAMDMDQIELDSLDVRRNSLLQSLDKINQEKLTNRKPNS